MLYSRWDLARGRVQGEPSIPLPASCFSVDAVECTVGFHRCTLSPQGSGQGSAKVPVPPASTLRCCSAGCCYYGLLMTADNSSDVVESILTFSFGKLIASLVVLFCPFEMVM